MALVQYRVCPELVEDLIRKKENGSQSVILHNKDIAALLLPTDVPWNRRPIPHEIIVQSLKLLRAAQKFPPRGFKSKERQSSLGMTVEFIRVGVGVSN